MSINRVNISGHLTRDPELRMTPKGTQVLSFGIAVNDRRLNRETNQWEDYPNFVECTMFGTRAKGPRYLELTEGYVTRLALDEDKQIIGYEFIHLGKMMAAIKKGTEPAKAMEDAKGSYGRFAEAASYIDPREQ